MALETSNTENQRSIIERYLTSQDLLQPEAGKIPEPLGDYIKVSVIVPAYYEEKTLPHLLSALDRQEFRQFEVIVVDNGSKDNTIQVASNYRALVGYPLYIIKELRPGPGHARKTGMDEIARRVFQRDRLHPRAHYLVTTDADAIPPTNWLREIVSLFEKTQCGALGGPHTAASWIDEKIKIRLGIPNFFAQVAHLNAFLAQNDIGLLKLSGPNSASTVEAYISVGGMIQPYQSSGVVDLKEISQFAQSILAHHHTIEALPVVIVTSRRRHLLELIKGHNMYFAMNHQRNRARFITVRVDEAVLLNHALEHAPLERWIAYQNMLLWKVLSNVIIYPLLNGQIQLANVRKLLDESSWYELLGDVKKTYLSRNPSSNQEVAEALQDQWLPRLLRLAAN